MEDLVIRPSTKIVMASYAVAFLVTVGGAITAYILMPEHRNWWIGLLPGFGYEIAVAVRHIGILMEKLTFSDDHLHHEIGFISKSTRTINLAKVQDVTVLQSFKQRLLGMGRISVETSGGSSAIVVDNVDSPQKIANMILERSRQGPHQV